MDAPWPVVDRLLLGYFLTHLPATLLIDVQAVLPPAWIPSLLRELRAWYAYTMEDPLMRPDRPADELVWFHAMVVCELCFQLPIMLVAVQAFWPWSSATSTASASGHSSSSSYVKKLRRFRVPLLAFGVHTATTLVPVLAELYAWPTTGDDSSIQARLSMSKQSKALLYAFYVPYLLGPLLLVWRMLPFFATDNCRPAVCVGSTSSKKHAADC